MNEKRNLDYKNINDPIMAYMSGYLCRTWFDRHYEFYDNMFKSFIDVILVRNIFIEENATIFKKFICDNFNVVGEYKEDYNNPFADNYLGVKIDIQYKKIIEDNLIIDMPKEMIPYMLLGFYHGNGHKNSGSRTDMYFNGSNTILLELKYLLMQNYEFNDEDFMGDPELVKGTFAYILCLSNKGTEKIMKLLPSNFFADYIK